MRNLSYYILLYTLLSFSMSSAAQDWAEEGSEFTFQRDINLGAFGATLGCDRWEFTGDTIIEGISYQKLRGSYLSRNYAQGGQVSDFEQSSRPEILLRTDGEITWFLHEGVEYVQADFGAQTGAQWDVPMEIPASGIQLGMMTITVDSIGTTDMGGQRPVMYYSYTIEDCTDGDLPIIGHAMVVKGLFHRYESGIESIIPIVPDGPCAVDAADFSLFSEYTIDGVILYSEGITANEPLICSFSDVGLDSPNELDFQVFPNPSHEVLNIQLENPHEMASVEVLDVAGQVVLRSVYRPAIDITSLDKGMYLLRLYDHSGRSSAQVLTVE